jgi:hypothetical protein
MPLEAHCLQVGKASSQTGGSFGVHRPQDFRQLLSIYDGVFVLPCDDCLSGEYEAEREAQIDHSLTILHATPILGKQLLLLLPNHDTLFLAHQLRTLWLR